MGFPERDGSNVYNAVVVVGADGTVLARYRKTHLFGDVDREQFSEGGIEPPIFEIDGFKIGLLICYDVEFPENVRALALQGADFVIVPTALMQPFDVVAKMSFRHAPMKTRSTSRMSIAAAARVRLTIAA